MKTPFAKLLSNRLIHSAVLAGLIGQCAVVLAPAAANAAPSASASLGRVKSMLGRLDSQFKQIEDRFARGDSGATAIDGLAKKFATVEEIFADIAAKLAEVPESEPGRKEMVDQVTAAQKRRDALLVRFEALKGGAASTAEGLENGAATDGPAAERLLDQLRQIKDAMQYDSGNIDAALQSKDILAEAEALLAKYPDHKPRGTHSNAARDFAFGLSTLSRALAGYKADVLPAFLSNGAGALEQAMQSLTSQVAKAKSERHYFDFLNTIPAATAAVRHRADTWEAIAGQQPGYDAGLVTRARKTADDAVAAGQALRDEIIKANQPPADTFTGSDGAKLRAQAKKTWETNYPKHKVVRAVLRAEAWDRRSAWEYNRGTQKWVFHDISFIPVDVYVASDDGKYAYRYFGRLVQDHRAGTGPQMLTEMVSGPPVAPAAIFLMAKFK